MTGADRTKRKLGIFRVRCVSCEVKPNTKGKPQVEALLEWGHGLQCQDADHLKFIDHQLLQWYGDLSPKSAKYTLASLRALVRSPRRHEVTRVSELATLTTHPEYMADAFASVISESYNGEDRIRVEYIYPIDHDPAHPLNGSPMGPRGTPADVARIDMELAPAAIESAHARERMAEDGEVEEDASDVVIVQLPASMVDTFNKRNALRSNRHMRRLAQHIARQVKQ